MSKRNIVSLPASPSPHGEGGLKRALFGKGLIGHMSLPTRGGWIETLPPLGTQWKCGSPSPHGEGGLKLSPRWAPSGNVESLPTRGGWIETIVSSRSWFLLLGSLPTRGGWIETRSCRAGRPAVARPSPHGEGGLKQYPPKY